MKRIFIIGCFLLFLWGCYQPLEGDLYDDYEPTLVIESNFSNDEPPYYTYVSITSPPDGPINSFSIIDANVKIVDEGGIEITAENIGYGKYVFNNYDVTPSKWYHLAVTYDNKVYTSDEQMPSFPVIDSVQLDFKENFVDGPGLYFKLFIKTKIDTIQYYRTEVFKNGNLFNDYSDLLVFNDSYTTDQFAWTAPYAFESGDSVVIKLHGISENMYKYYYGLNRQTTNSFSNIQPPMLNPPSNIQNNPLGYFQVSAITIVDSVLNLDSK